MSFKVDIDEADVAVLNQNLTKSKDLFNQISKSLYSISTNTSTASTKIKPILKDVNKLNNNKKQIDKGLAMLQDVSRYAELTSNHESILNNSIELIGLKKFITSLSQSKLLLHEMKSHIKNFKGIMINFETLIDKSDLKLQNYFQKLCLSSDYKIKEICMIIKYFENDNSDYILKNYIRIRANKFTEAVKPYENVSVKSSAPYEKGTNGMHKFNTEFIACIDNEIAILSEINKSGVQLDSEILKDIIERGLNSDYNDIVSKFNNFISTNGIMSNEVMILELISNLLDLEAYLRDIKLSFPVFIKFNDSFNRLVSNSSSIFKDVVRLIENKITSADKLNDKNIPEVTVELISRIRKISEFHNSLIQLIYGYKLGDWLLIKPPVKFVSTYTSVIPNATEGIDESSPDFLLSCYYSDLIDAIIVSIEIELKSEVSLKKSTQGFYLLKDLILIEGIVNRSQQLFDALGNLGIERMNKLKNRYLKMFLDDWNYASYIIIRDMTSITTSHAQSHSLGSGMSNKEREQVKDLFKNFNESFEEALRNYEKYNITDVNLKSYLGNEIKKLILNAYFKLYDKYANSEFTKNKAKYVKYDKILFERLLNDKLK
ncbi:uncharacterized protein PRCAT00003335001 [Priceomyces carsonii]|uniref:uncharacterized protein n=1 Tax=Priceomyces carsonii TaxID=28549 RepID=UPI002EDAA3A8|nr:unnamed protein product [Priceomyces carsonii]